MPTFRPQRLGGKCAGGGGGGGGERGVEGGTVRACRARAATCFVEQ